MKHTTTLLNQGVIGIILVAAFALNIPVQAQIVNESFESIWTSEGTYGPHVIPPHNFTSLNTYYRDGKAYKGNRSVEFNGEVGAYLQTPELLNGIGEVSFYVDATARNASRKGYFEYQISDDGVTYAPVGTPGWIDNFFSYKNITITVNSPTAKYFRIIQTQTSSEYARTQVDFMSVSGYGEPEPSGHVTELTYSSKTAHAISLTWNDTNTISPAKGYVIKASAAGVEAISEPVDTVPSSDSMFVKVVMAPTKACTFVDLPPETTFAIRVFPFTNTEAAIDYLTSGEVATTSITTNELPDTIMNEGFESKTLNGWTQQNILGHWAWQPYFYQNRNLVFLYGFQAVNEDWLISPPLYLNYYTNAIINFNNSRNGTEPTLKLLYSTHYDGKGDPNAFEWTELPATWSPQNFYVWKNSGDVDLSMIRGEKTYLALFYKNSVNTETSVWLIDDILIKGTPIDQPTTALITIEIDSIPIPDFDPSVMEYWVEIPDLKSAKMGSNINCQAACGLASVEVVNATNLYGTLEERTATITVTAPGGATKMYTIIFYSPSTRLSDIEVSTQPQFMRNPFYGAMQIRNWEQFEILEVYDLSGKAMGSYRINNTSISQTTDLLEGVYIVKIYNREGEVYVRKVVKYKK